MRAPRRWPVRLVAGLACLVLGLASFAFAASVVIRHQSLFEVVPDWRVTGPLWAAAVVAAAVSRLRREGALGLSVAGAALASAAMALGWVLVLAMVASVALLVIYVMSEAF